MPSANVQPGSDRFYEALRRFDEANAQDPNQETVNGSILPRELAYSQWLTTWVLRLQPEASEALRLAARCQHVCRWLIPRNAYPLTRAGYLKWRADLKKLHARKAGEILHETGYPEETVKRVQELNLKSSFPHDPESRIIEDALCLVFLEHQFTGLAAKTTEEKLINAVQKTWRKMTPTAQALAAALPLPPAQKQLITRALAENHSCSPAPLTQENEP